MKRRVNTLWAGTCFSLPLVIVILFCACQEGGDGNHNGNGETCGMSDAEMQLLELINNLRARGTDCGGTAYGPTHPLYCHPALVTAAQQHSADMAENNYFDHTGLDGRSPWDRMEDAGYTDGGHMGENIAAGPSDPEGVRASWEGSAQHCANMMNPAFHVAGVGFASREGTTYTNYWTLTLAAGSN